MLLHKLLLLSGLALSCAGPRRGKRSIDPPSYGSGGRSARSYEFTEESLDGEYSRRPRQAASTGYGAPGGGAQPTYNAGGGGGGGGGGGVGGGGVRGGAGRQGGVPGAGGGEPLMPYRYGYAVQDDIGNDFNQQEQSDGAQITGQYSVVLPDCRIQTVTYSVRPETGFVAEVSYSDVGANCIPAPPGDPNAGGGGVGGIGGGGGGFGGGGGGGFGGGGAQANYGGPIRR